MFLTTKARIAWVQYKKTKYPFIIATRINCGVRPEDLKVNKLFCRMPFPKRKYAVWLFEDKQDLENLRDILNNFEISLASK